MAEFRWIRNLKGVLHYLDTPLLDFEVRDRQLIHWEMLTDGSFFPPELRIYGVTYSNLNEFFQRRTLKEGCMFYREHLRAIGMERFDFDLYIKKNNGNNNLDNYWILFEDFGARTFSDICTQNYPVPVPATLATLVPGS